ncbi:MCM family protein [Natronobacterium gregoryi SP2]|uniref:MCM family protein n=1 Tax=Natronobacterium gregoryi (strain ATCC 43098 / DSM 3393 / CCM 3738 / CIP 104747 / IAM 13177 / JCM 8860 / NBRC 102187 / NCIMB 2189 / SP2) TaxID=797304 RepID=L9YEL5_NATGS|nr:MCM family protein [Natronobacterium gregoryi SP2]
MKDSYTSDDKYEIDDVSPYSVTIAVEYFDWYFDENEWDEEVDELKEQYRKSNKAKYMPEQYGEPLVNDMSVAMWMTYWQDKDDDYIEWEDIESVWWIRWMFANNPVAAMQCATYALRLVREDPYVDAVIGDLPEEPTTSIENIRSPKHDYKLISLDVKISSLSASYPLLYRVRGRCPACTEEQTVWQDRFAGHVDEPESCDVENCSGNIVVDDEHMDYITSQEAVVQDMHKYSSKNTPEDITASLDKPLVENVQTGDEVSIAAICEIDDSVQGPRGNYHLHIVGLDRNGDDYEKVEVTDEEREEIEELSEDPEIFQRLADSIAPTISTEPIDGEDYSQEELAKKAVLMQLVGGNDINDVDERNYINIFFVGGPATGKTQIARAAVDISPVGIEVNSRSTTEVGLTATVDREERFGSDEWVVSGGAYVAADEGVVFLDELDKADDGIVDVLHGPMENGTVTKQAANISAELKAETATVATANPIDTHFNLYEPFPEQIDIVPSMLSRFDLIVPFVDKVDEDKDTAVMSKYAPGNDHDPDENDYFDYDFIQKYVAVARQYQPEFTGESYALFDEYYKELRKKSERDEGRISVDARDGESLRRLSQASARIRLSEEIGVRDVERAMNMIMASLEMVAEDQYGNLDKGLLNSGESASQKQEKEQVYEIVEALNQTKNVVPPENIYKQADEQYDIPDYRVDASLQKLVGDKLWKNDKGFGVID